jgi:hypothetical protein
MSLLSREIEVYDFSAGTTHWRYTDSERVAIVLGFVYSPAVPQRGRIAQSSESSKAGLEIVVPLTLPLLEIFRPTAPDVPVSIDMKRIRTSDGLVREAWSGLVNDVELGQSVAKIRCISLEASLDAIGLRRNWQSGCPLTLYGTGLGQCNADPQAFGVPATLTNSTGIEVSSPAFDAFTDGHFNGGYIEWPSSIGIRRRFIVSHVGDTLRLLTTASLPIGFSLTGYPGCNHTIGAGGCAKFSNEPNYGGQHTLKGLVSPFGSDPVF